VTLCFRLLRPGYSLALLASILLLAKFSIRLTSYQGLGQLNTYTAILANASALSPSLEKNIYSGEEPGE
jgi:hypothetical protein